MTRFCDHALGGLLTHGGGIMGIVNVTPDSFSDGGEFLNSDRAIEHGLRLLKEGADILDIGGESTRPGAQSVDPEEETKRVLPVIEGLKDHAPWISIDTRNAKTMAEALKAGANIINDVSALRHDSHSKDVVREAGVPVCLMHMQNNPQIMQDNPNYRDVVTDIHQFFADLIHQYETFGIDKKYMILDPGIGFGKTVEHNLAILRNIKKFNDFGLPVLLGTSRKSFIPALSAGEPPDDRIPGSLSSAIWGLSQGVTLFRVHDVAQTRQAFQIYEAIVSAEETYSEASSRTISSSGV